MRTYNSNYIDGEFQPVSVAMISNSVLAGVGLAAGYIPSKSLSPALTTQHIPLVNPTSERLEGHCAISNTETVNSAVQAAKRAQKAYSKTSLVQRASYLDSILRECQKREEDFAQVLHRQIGCPLQFARIHQVRASFGHIEDAIVALRGSADGSVPSVVNQAADGHLLPNANARSLSRSASSGIGSMAPDSVTGNVGNVNVKANAVLRKSGPFSTDNDTDTDTDRATRAERSERGDSGYRGEREEARNKAKYPFQYRFNDHHVDLSQEQGQSELEPFIKDNLSESAKQEIVSSISNSNENENEIESGTYLYPPSNSVYSYSSEGGEYNVNESNTDLSTNVTSRTAVTLDSVGVVAIVTPWSWPLNQLLMKIAPALAAGCCVVVKPSEKCPGISLLLAETIHAAGLPKGIFGLLLGDGSTGSALVGHPAVDMVSFTGKEHTGKSVAALAVDGMKRLHLEMGGKASNILLMPDMHDTDTPGTDTSTYNNDDASASTSGNTSDSTGGTTSAIASSTKSTNTSTNTIGNSTSLGLSFQGQFPIPLGGREKLVQESLQNLKETLLSVLANSGQNCTAATNLLVPRAYMSQAEDTAAVLFGSTVFTNYAGSSGSGYASGSPPYLTLVSSPTSPNRNKKDIFNFLAGESESECKEAAPVHVHKHVHSVDKSVEDGDLRSRTTNSVCMGMGMEIGPLGSQEQYQRCQRLMVQAIEDGARLLVGGPVLPNNVTEMGQKWSSDSDEPEIGYYMKPTVFTDVDFHWEIAKEESFGPILCIIPYDSLYDAVEMANSPIIKSGLSNTITCANSPEEMAKASSLAQQLECGSVCINTPTPDMRSPFGGVKQNGVGREGGPTAILGFLETKTISHSHGTHSTHGTSIIGNSSHAGSNMNMNMRWPGLDQKFSRVPLGEGTSTSRTIGDNKLAGCTQD